MKKSFAKPLKLQIKPVFQFSAADNDSLIQDVLATDPITVTTVTATKVFNAPALR